MYSPILNPNSFSNAIFNLDLKPNFLFDGSKSNVQFLAAILFCIITGCVPSKALIACARAFHSTKLLSEFGVKIPDGEVTVDFNFVMERMRKIRAKISHHDSVQRYSKEFCEHVYIGSAKFTGGNKVEVIGDDGTPRILSFKKAMIASGASAAVPPIPGLKDAPFLTNSNFFNQTELPPRMLVRLRRSLS